MAQRELEEPTHCPLVLRGPAGTFMFAPRYLRLPVLVGAGMSVIAG